jgi:hypothetical protein
MVTVRTAAGEQALPQEIARLIEAEVAEVGESEESEPAA